MKAKYRYIFLVFSALLVLASCSGDRESKEPFDPKSHISESRYDEISLVELFNYISSAGKLKSPMLNRFELTADRDGSISNLSLEVVDTESGKSHNASYDSKSDIFKIKLDEYVAEEKKLFDLSLLESAESLLENLEADQAFSIYFLTELSSGSIDANFPQSSDVFLLEKSGLQEIESPEIPKSETLYFFAIHNLNSSADYPSYFIVDPKKI